MSISNTNSDVYLDFQGLAQLKANAGRQSPEALEQVAEQFEAVFLQMMLKSMRQASLGEGLFDNDQSRLYQEMFDQQIALDMANKRQAGIADAMLKQLGSDATPKDPAEASPMNFDQLRFRAPAFALTAPATKSEVTNTTSVTETIKGFDSPDDFVTKLWPTAEKYAEELGVAPQVLLAQAALETGWGQSVSRHDDGQSTHNLFNIKADERWDGPRAVVATLEYEEGIPQRQFATFRAYRSFEESFQDYVKFLQESPRYGPALERAGDSQAYIESLQGAGYATDPDYSRKIMNIMQRDHFLNTTSILQDAGPEPLT